MGPPAAERHRKLPPPPPGQQRTVADKTVVAQTVPYTGTAPAMVCRSFSAASGVATLIILRTPLRRRSEAAAAGGVQHCVSEVSVRGRHTNSTPLVLGARAAVVSSSRADPDAAGPQSGAKAPRAESSRCTELWQRQRT